MKARIFSSIILILVLICSIRLGSYFFGLVMLLCAILGYRELFQIKYHDKSNQIAIMKFIGFVCLVLMCLNGVFFEIDDSLIMLYLMLFFMIPIVFYNDSRIYNINDAFFLIGSVCFLGYAFHNIIYFASVDMYQCIFIFLISFVTDTYAYIGGSLIGKRKLTDISPKKTVEGTIIGTFMGCLVGSVYYYLAIGGISVPLIILICFALTVLSEFGDLVFSSIKRYFNQKDYSQLIPGHGGILDRFDSVIFVSIGVSILMKIL